MNHLGNRHSQYSASKVPTMNMARTKFDRSFATKDTMYFDQLVPVYLEEILPGDTINLNVKSFCRLAPQVRPLLDNMYMDYFFFFVPNRLVWNNWEKFNGAQDNPGDSVDFIIPKVQRNTTGGWFPINSLGDHFGLPTGIDFQDGEKISALPFRGYDLIWNWWFRDQNLQNSIAINKGDGPDNVVQWDTPKYRAKRPDYFTAALPWPQKGQPVMMPLSGTAPVYASSPTGTTNGGMILQAWNTSIPGVQVSAMNSDGGGTLTAGNFAVGTGAARITLGTEAQYSANPGFAPPYADLTEATGASINAFRQAIMMQSLLERDARGGTRYVEILRSHFNVISPDFRLQIPELLSVGEVKISQHPIAQTSETTVDSPQGNLSAFSTAAEFRNRIGFNKSFVEHGYVIGLVQARGDITYQQGINRMWARQTRWDFFWPELQQMGEQPIRRGEIYAQDTIAANDVTFGYIGRYDEYRYSPSYIKGQFRSAYAQSLDVWHLAEEFETAPALNATFIRANTPIERALVVPDPEYPHLLCDFWFDLKHARPILANAVPASLGRF